MAANRRMNEVKERPIVTSELSSQLGGIAPDLSLVADALRLRWRWILTLVLLTPPLAILVNASFPPKLKSRARLLVQESVSVNPFLKDMSVEWSVKRRLPVIQSVLSSRETVEHVLLELGRLQPGDDPTIVDTEIRNFRRMTMITGLGGGVIQIDVKGHDGLLVYEGLQLLMKRLVNEMLRPQKQAMDDSVDFLSRQVERVRKELAVIEEALRTFKRGNLETLPDVYRARLATRGRVLKEILDARTDLAGSRRRKALLGDRLSRYDPAIQDLERQLVSARQRYERLSASYTSRHPAVSGAATRVRGLEAGLKRARARHRALPPEELQRLARIRLDVEASPKGTAVVEKATDLLTGELLQYKRTVAKIATLEERIASLVKRSKESERAIRDYADTQPKLGALLRDQQTKTKVYQRLLERHEDARVTRALTMHDEASQVWVLEAPSRPRRKKALSVPVAAIVGGIAGLFIALGLILIAELLDSRLRGPQEVEQLLGVDILGNLPLRLEP